MKKLSEKKIIEIMNKKNKHFLSEDVEIFKLGKEQCAVCVDTLVESTDIPKGFTIKISLGKRVNTEIIARSIAIPVNTPK